MTIDPGSGAKDNLKRELARQLQKDDQVASRIIVAVEVNELAVVLVEIPRHGGGDDPEARALDPLKADRPVALVDAEVVKLGGIRLIRFFTNGESIPDDP